MSAYKNTPASIASATRMIVVKVQRQNVLLRRYKRFNIAPDYSNISTIQDLLLREARAGKRFWSIFRELTPLFTGFKNRDAHAPDVTNKLLDIGYHHLTNLVKKILEKHDVSPALGLIHVARNADSAPLAYDLVELFRADIVDTEVLRFLRLKKKPFLVLGATDVSYFLHNINQRLEKEYYIRDFKQCQTYRYYMELQVLRFMHAVNHREVFNPVYLPTRHDGRCQP